MTLFFRPAISLIALVCALSASAQTLTLTGEIDAARLNEIASSSQEISTLDLSGAVIVAYNGPRLAANRSYHPANVLPAYVLSGLKASKVILPQSITAIEDGALMGADITEITIPPTVTAIGQGAFAACTALKSISIPQTVARIGSHTFAGCTALTSATIGAKALPASTFADCTALSSVTLASGLDSIGADAFAGCTALSGISIPATVTSIGDRAFARSGLTALNLNNLSSLRHIGTQAFAHCLKLREVILPAQASLATGVFFDTPSLSAVALPASLKSLPDLTFKGSKSLIDAAELLPGQIDSIGRLALAGMLSAKHITLPKTLKYIDSEAFDNWKALQYIDATSLNAVPDLGDDVWRGIDKSKVFLDTDSEVTELFMAAPQWQEFAFDSSDITTVLSPVDDIQLNVRFEGLLLRIAATTHITAASLYDLAGRVVAYYKGAGAESLTLDTAASAETFFILTVTLDNGQSGSIKLLRQ